MELCLVGCRVGFMVGSMLCDYEFEPGSLFRMARELRAASGKSLSYSEN